MESPELYQDQGFASLGIGNQRLGLHAGEVAGASDAQTSPVFEVEAYAESEAKLESRGCELYFENETPKTIFGTFKDPDGKSLQIMQDR